MKIRRAVVAGLAGCLVVIAAMMIVGTMTDRGADLCALAGAVVTGRDGAGAWLVGLVAQVVVAIVAALVYAAIFEWIVRRAGALMGFAIALAHVAVAGIAVGFLPVSGMLSAGMSPPGAFLEYRGWWVIGTFVLAHLAFGVIVGMVYGKPLHSIETMRGTWNDVTVLQRRV